MWMRVTNRVAISRRLKRIVVLPIICLLLILLPCAVPAYSADTAAILVVKSNVRSANVMVEGILFGHPFDALKVSPGHLHIELVAVGYPNKVIEIEVKSGKTKVVTINLAKPMKNVAVHKESHKVAQIVQKRKQVADGSHTTKVARKALQKTKGPETMTASTTNSSQPGPSSAAAPLPAASSPAVAYAPAGRYPAASYPAASYPATSYASAGQVTPATSTITIVAPQAMPGMPQQNMGYYQPMMASPAFAYPGAMPYGGYAAMQPAPQTLAYPAAPNGAASNVSDPAMMMLQARQQTQLSGMPYTPTYAPASPQVPRFQKIETPDYYQPVVKGKKRAHHHTPAH